LTQKGWGSYGEKRKEVADGITGLILDRTDKRGLGRSEKEKRSGGRTGWLACAGEQREKSLEAEGSY